jgi:hypothetical protein
VGHVWLADTGASTSRLKRPGGEHFSESTDILPSVQDILLETTLGEMSVRVGGSGDGQRRGGALPGALTDPHPETVVPSVA